MGTLGPLAISIVDVHAEDLYCQCKTIRRFVWLRLFPERVDMPTSSDLFRNGVSPSQRYPKIM